MQICIDATCDDDYRSVADLEGFPPVDCEGTSYLQEKYPEDKRQGALEKAEIWINRRPPGAWAYTGFMKNLKAPLRIWRGERTDVASCVRNPRGVSSRSSLYWMGGCPGGPGCP